jgi:hypothetical protein
MSDKDTSWQVKQFFSSLEDSNSEWSIWFRLVKPKEIPGTENCGMVNCCVVTLTMQALTETMIESGCGDMASAGSFRDNIIETERYRTGKRLILHFGISVNDC